ncbi:MAG: hypothetical protein N2Z75_05195 [Meiothermus sp.]|uniref:hypothetical protein n=1 Tax=Meiothermus sp. TaxID=1955249 RepID=UPI0025F526F6|nr:hypothetical protein [Meiothermus sp.]MCS7068558.1 hypothetical protein [Meiothermus sp.]MCX7601320.1 hypothetical protein [Meiothermus sp.]MDW8425814.1 hypothetical protein [Meiothermus sp.]
MPLKLYWTELIEASAPLVLRRWGLVQLSGLALAVQAMHLTLAWLALPSMRNLPPWVVWAVEGFFGLMLLVIGVLRFRPSTRRPHLEPVRQIFWDALWLGVAGLAAIFAVRMGSGLGVVLFLALGLAGYGIGFGRLWFGLSKT